MGTLIENCYKCSKNEENDEDNSVPSPIIKPKTIETKIGDSHCEGIITINKQESSNINQNDKNSKEFIFQSQFHRDPFDSYKIINEISPNIKLVNYVSNPIKINLMKIIDRSDIANNNYKKELFLEEIEKLQLLDHPNLDKILEIFIQENNFYLICDYNEDNNNIIGKIKNCGIEESSINKIMEQILKVVLFLHDKEIFNIELKLEDLTIIEMTLQSTKKRILKKGTGSNINKEDNNVKKRKTYDVKLLDLGYLNFNYNPTDLNYLKYYSPEIIGQIEKNDLNKKSELFEENYKTDEWACGIIMYYLACGEFPFDGESKEEIIKKIKESSLDFSSPKFGDISDSCKDLISKLLEKDKNKRIKSGDCLDHPFFTGETFIKIEEEKEEIDKEILKDLLSIRKPKSKFHELIIAYLCYHFLDKNEELKLKEIFNYIDQDHNNIISEEDIKNAFNKNNIKYTDEDINNILNVFDYDNNKLIQYQEFLRVLCNKDNLFNENNLKATFDAIDTDNNNLIDAKDIQEFIPHDEETMNKIEKEFMEPFGMKADNKIIYTQFREIIIKDKTFDEVNNYKSRIEKIREQKKVFELEQKENEKED